MSTAEMPNEVENETEQDREDLERLRNWEAEILEAERDVMAAESELAEQKELAKEAKAHFETKVSALRRLVRASREQLPLFDGQPKKQPDPWREVEITEALSLTPKQIDILAEAGIDTVGKFEDLRAGNGLVSLDGIGPATADKLEEMMLDWLTENRDKEVLAGASVEVTIEANGQSVITTPEELEAAVERRLK